MSRADSSTPTSSTSHGSYPSRQRRFGPAPLASFEDLQTDECQSSSEDEKPGSVRMACPQISLIITDHNEVEHQIDTVRLPFNRSDVSHSLNCPPVKVENKRKGSWTDIFSVRKSPTPTKTRERKFSLFNFNFFSKEVKNDAQSECELQSLVITETSSRAVEFTSDTHEIGVQVGNFEEIKAAYEEQISNENEYDLTPTNFEPPSLSLLETVVHVEQQPNSAVDLEDDNQTIVDSTSLCSASSCSCSLNNNGSETEPEAPCAECERMEKNLPCSCDELDTDAADNEDNDEETEQHVESDIDELESLLTGDELEQNANLNADQLPLPPFPSIPVLSCPDDGLKAIFKLSTEKLKTSPIERPHSITPINMSSFEAYIKCPPPLDNISDGDRLTIKIPGLHSNQRNRFTRKSNPYIWQDFCEKGLKSPKIESAMSRKRANSCFPEINQNCYLNEAFSPNENLTPITPIKDIDGAEDRFDDNFWDYLNRNKSVESDDAEGAVKAALNSLRKLQSSCSCDCNSSVASTTAYNIATSIATCSEMSSYSESSDNDQQLNESSISGSVPEAGSLRSEFHEDQPLVSPCDCVCHRAQHSLNQFSLVELSTSLGTNLCADSRDGEALYDSRNTEDDDLSQLSSSTLSSSSSTATSTSQSVRLLDTSATSNV